MFEARKTTYYICDLGLVILMFAFFHNSVPIMCFGQLCHTYKLNTCPDCSKLAWSYVLSIIIGSLVKGVRIRNAS